MNKFFSSLRNLFKRTSRAAVEPGQVWQFPDKSDNPFDTTPPSLYTVFAVKDGWVQYKDPNGKICSCEIWWFCCGAARVS